MTRLPVPRCCLLALISIALPALSACSSGGVTVDQDVPDAEVSSLDAGAEVSGPCSVASDCDDSNDCTQDSCLADGTCLNTPLTGDACDDGNACTDGDTCTTGVCAGTAVICDDSNGCTEDSCDPKAGCMFDNLTDGSACEDGSLCTAGDECQAGVCQSGENPWNCPADCTICGDAVCGTGEDLDNCPVDCDTACGNGLCEGGETPQECAVDCGWCGDDKCSFGETPEGCPGDCSAECGDGECEEELGETEESCLKDCFTNPDTDGDGVVENDNCPLTANPAQEDFDNDGQGDACDMDDDNDGENDASDCGPQDDEVSHLAEEVCDGKDNNCDDDVDEDVECTDGNECTVDICGGEEGCLHAPSDPLCDDGNVCTDDTCELDLGCQYANNQAQCEDGSVCTLDDVCANGTCQPGTDLPCDDGNPCTADTCDPLDGCQHEPLTGQQGENLCCVAENSECDDGNDCTMDTCIPALNQCMNNALPDNLECDDGEPCTTDEKCAAGICEGQTYECDDDVACTDNVCDGDGGCEHPPSEDWCLIGGECVEEGEKSQLNPCITCQPDEDQYEFSPDDAQECPLSPWATAIQCLAGVCAVLECELGRGNCDGNHLNGCETNTDVHLTHCSQCDDPCVPGEVCSSGECKAECDEGLTKCPDVGCVDTDSDPGHCGNCTTVCDYDFATPLCVEGGCQMGECHDMRGDANNSPEDGCECMITNMGDEICNEWDDDCNGLVDDVAPGLTQSDPLNCGECGNKCESGEDATIVGTCFAGECGVAPCEDNLWNLDFDAANGCEYGCEFTGDEETCDEADNNCDGEADEGFDLMNDPLNCGACGHVCFHETASEFLCAGGSCIVLHCQDGYKDGNGIGDDGCEVEWQPNGELWVDSWSGGTAPGFDGTEDFPFSTIQEALVNAFSGYLIHVNEGIYTGGIKIDLADLTIEGAGSDVVFVATPDYETGFHITADNVSISGLAISGGQYGVHFKGPRRCRWWGAG